MSGIRQEAAGMRQDDLDPWTARDHPVQHELHGGARCIERIVDDGAGDALDDRDRRLGRMDEDHGRAPFELRPKRAESGIAQIVAGIVAEQDHAIHAERVERILELAHRALRVGQRQGGEAGEAIPPPRHEFGAELVDCARHVPAGGTLPAGHPGSRERQYGCGDPLGVHEGERGIGGPGRAMRPRRGAAMARQRLGPNGWDQMMVYVDAVRTGHESLPFERGRIRSAGMLPEATTRSWSLHGATCRQDTIDTLFLLMKRSGWGVIARPERSTVFCAGSAPRRLLRRLARDRRAQVEAQHTGGAARAGSGLPPHRALGRPAAVLSRRYRSIATTTAAEKELAWLRTGAPDITVDRLTGLLRHLKPDGLAWSSSETLVSRRNEPSPAVRRFIEIARIRVSAVGSCFSMRSSCACIAASF